MICSYITIQNLKRNECLINVKDFIYASDEVQYWNYFVKKLFSTGICIYKFLIVPFWYTFTTELYIKIFFGKYALFNSVPHYSKLLMKSLGDLLDSLGNILSRHWTPYWYQGLIKLLFESLCITSGIINFKDRSWMFFTSTITDGGDTFNSILIQFWSNTQHLCMLC